VIRGLATGEMALTRQCAAQTLWQQVRVGQGLTLVHFSAQPEPFLTQNTQITPKHLLIPPCTY
jgi:hypothetical protein